MTAGADIEAALGDVAKGLEAGDLTAAAASIQTLVACCQAAQGTRLSPDQITRLAEMLQRCTDLAAATQGRLTASLVQFGNGGRAQRAYGER